MFLVQAKTSLSSRTSLDETMSSINAAMLYTYLQAIEDPSTTPEPQDAYQTAFAYISESISEQPSSSTSNITNSACDSDIEEGELPMAMLDTESTSILDIISSITYKEQSVQFESAICPKSESILNITTDLIQALVPDLLGIDRSDNYAHMDDQLSDDEDWWIAEDYYEQTDDEKQ